MKVYSMPVVYAYLPFESSNLGRLRSIGSGEGTS